MVLDSYSPGMKINIEKIKAMGMSRKENKIFITVNEQYVELGNIVTNYNRWTNEINFSYVFLLGL